MTRLSRTDRTKLLTTAGLATGMLLVALLAGTSAAAPTPHASVTPASSATEQWAFGGSVSSSYSCTTTDCPGGTLSANQTLGISYNAQLHWAVIYTRTNVSASQVELSVKAAIGASVSLSFSACVTTTTCQTESLSASVSGWETAAGYTNVTTASLTLASGPDAPGPVTALAIMNAAASLAFNVSGNLNLNVPGTPATTASISFDVGGHGSSTVNFPTPLAILPVSPNKYDNWTSSEPFTASGSYLSGISAHGTEDGESESASAWTPGNVATSGTIYVVGNDTGTSTVWNNYTTPHKSYTVQDILLNISGDNYTATDGWVLYSGAAFENLFSGLEAETAPVTAAVSPAISAGVYSAPESVYYTSANGVLGESLAGNISSIDSSLSGAPSLSVNAGPEPVSVAESQYNAITAGPAAAAFPLALVLGAVVVVVVVVAVVALVMRNRSAGRRPPTADTPLNPPMAGDTPMSPAGLQPPTGGQP